MRRVLFLVEGSTDKQRLSALSSVFEKMQIIIIPIGGDILSRDDYKNQPFTLIKKILEKDKLYEVTDFDEIIQITDTDACFISGDNYISSSQSNHIIYFEDHVETKNIKTTIALRRCKAKNIKKLLSNPFIKLYYNSINIDHAFSGVANLTTAKKRALALKMYHHEKNNPLHFIKTIKEVNSSNIYDYKKSWEYIMHDKNSLSRSSNLLIFILDHYEYLKKDIKTFISLSCSSKDLLDN